MAGSVHKRKIGTLSLRQDADQIDGTCYLQVVIRLNQPSLRYRLQAASDHVELFGLDNRSSNLEPNHAVRGLQSDNLEIGGLHTVLVWRRIFPAL